MRQPQAVSVVTPAARLGRVVRALHAAAGVDPSRMLADFVFLPPVASFGKFNGSTLMELEDAQKLVVAGVPLLGVPLDQVTGYFGWQPMPYVRVELEPFGRNLTVCLSWLPPDEPGETLPGWDEVRCLRLLEVLFRHGRMVGGVNITDGVMELRAATESEPSTDELRYT